MLEISSMRFEDISEAVVAFKKIGWTKEATLFERYLMEEENGLRKCWIAKHNGDFAGYITLVYKSNYKHFVENNIPEIVDLNVLPHFRRQGIGQILLKTAELEALKYSNTVGIGVGLYGGEDGGYGNAQRLYVKNGYIPDGNGVTYNELIAIPGRSYPIDDELILWMTKKLG
jgi:GNAT superfamily N-acetyltransferase